MCGGKGHLRGDVLRADLRDADRVGGDAAVSGNAVDRLYLGVFFQFPDDGVLTAATADDQKVHRALLIIRILDAAARTSEEAARQQVCTVSRRLSGGTGARR